MIVEKFKEEQLLNAIIVLAIVISISMALTPFAQKLFTFILLLSSFSIFIVILIWIFLMLKKELE